MCVFMIVQVNQLHIKFEEVHVWPQPNLLSRSHHLNGGSCHGSPHGHHCATRANAQMPTQVKRLPMTLKLLLTIYAKL